MSGLSISYHQSHSGSPYCALLLRALQSLSLRSSDYVPFRVRDLTKALMNPPQPRGDSISNSGEGFIG